MSPKNYLKYLNVTHTGTEPLLSQCYVLQVVDAVDPVEVANATGVLSVEFKFKSDEEFQIQAIESITKLFDGQHYVEAQFDLNEGGLAAIPNTLEVDNDTILENLWQIQGDNQLSVDETLGFIEETVPLFGEETSVCFPNFSVEMETGTGKTYVYLRTILELFRRYGLRKFIIAVPSVAVREGVIKTLKMTKSHLRQLYDNLPYRYYPYDSSKLSDVRQFAFSDSVEIFVMTIDSFNKASNRIYHPTDSLQGEVPIHFLQATRPILILDEPQNMVSELRVKALATLNPLFTLRYSATHRMAYNLVYCLTPAEAYKDGLVKKIEVTGIEQQDDVNQPFVRVNKIQSKGNRLTAQLSVHKLMRGGAVKEQSITVRFGDDLAQKTNRTEYNGYIVEEMSPGGYILFVNGVEIEEGGSRGEDKEAIFEAQIRDTIQEHFLKQERLKPSNIKVLSLFFIDRVNNYAPETGVIRRLFKKCFDELKQKHADWKDVNADRVQVSYFAHQRTNSGEIKRTESGEIIYQDSSTGTAQHDVNAYDLIMKEKEQLLSFDEPRCFIFSHSALREGWDSPNVFQICTLNQTASEIKKRQEIGRGVRLAVDQEGDRIYDETVNVLTVIANESYASYVGSLQLEMQDEYGDQNISPNPVNARERGVAKLRKAYTLKPEFKELWEQIKHKTRYAVNVDTDKLISEVVEELDNADIRPPRITRTKARVEIDDDHAFSALQMSMAKTVVDLAGRYSLPNLVDTIMHLLENTTPPMRLTKQTLLEIFMRAQNQQAALDNPHEFASVTAGIIKNKLTDQLIDGIKYEKIGECYEMCQFDTEIKSWKNRLIPAARSVYDHIIFDSGVEKQFVEELEKLDFVKLYVKLPAFFKVPTPIGTYNPDWAIVIEDADSGDPRMYLVRETKDSTDLDDLRPDEKRKINCGKKHFREALGVNYDVVDGSGDLRIK